MDNLKHNMADNKGRKISGTTERRWGDDTVGGNKEQHRQGEQRSPESSSSRLKVMRAYHINMLQHLFRISKKKMSGHTSTFSYIRDPD